MDFNQMNNNPVQPGPNAFNAQQPYGQPQGGFAQQPAGFAQQPGYTQPQAAFTQPQQQEYSQPNYDFNAQQAYDATANQQSYGWNGGARRFGHVAKIRHFGMRRLFHGYFRTGQCTREMPG